MSRTMAHRSRLPGAAWLIVTAGLSLSACVAHSIRSNTPPRVVTLRGTIFDSLTLAPLRGARVTLSAADTVIATTDTNGVFVVSLLSGTWRAEVAHRRFDSLRVPVPVRRLEVPPKAVVVAELATPSRRTVTRVLCSDTARNDDVALVGIVRDAGTRRGIDSAFVVVKWINLTLFRGTFVRSVETRITPTARDGWYVSCGIPAHATLLSWAEHAGATSGAVPLTLDAAPTRLDISLDPTALPSGGSIDLDPDSSGAAVFPIATGAARYRVLVRDPSGRPVSNARVRLLGRGAVRTNEAGAVTIDSIAGGTQTLEIHAIGYEPQRRTVDIVPSRVPTDTIVLASLQSLLDTVRITASRDPSGFERRRAAGVGQFITAADVERENPDKTTRLLRTRDGLRFTYDRHGFAHIEVTTKTDLCNPLILFDGFPAHPVPAIPGEAGMDWLIHPDEIGGVEIYTNGARVPPELARWGPACAVIVLWTREALGLPKSTSLRP